jgi:hypothetical protein
MVISHYDQRGFRRLISTVPQIFHRATEREEERCEGITEGSDGVTSILQALRLRQLGPGEWCRKGPCELPGQWLDVDGC